MDLRLLHQKLIVHARAATVSAVAPPGFERRVMACLQALAAQDPWTSWGRILWRVAIPCLVIMGISWVCAPGWPGSFVTDIPLGIQLEQTVLGPFGPLGETW